MSGKTVCRAFVDTCDQRKSDIAIRHFSEGSWRALSWSDYFVLVENVACGLKNLGAEVGTKIAIFANTRLEWAVSDLAILGLGAVTVPIYPNITSEDLKYILQNCEASIFICENQKMAQLFTSIRGACPNVKKLILFDGEFENALGWSALQRLGHPQTNFFRDCALARTQHEMATLSYTSGTTGVPKGVVLTHAQITSEISDAFAVVGITKDDVTLSFLPYAHVMGRIEMWGHVLVGYTLAFAQSIERIRSNLLVIRPTAMIAVPRIFEKIYIGILNQVASSPTRQKLFDWAQAVGVRISRAKVANHNPRVLDLLQYPIAKKLVFSAVHESLGGRLRVAVSGGAPLNTQIGEFFEMVGVSILQGYGLSETTGAIAVNTPHDTQAGTVGKPLGDTQVRIAEDGEILIKGQKVMKEYYRDPEATRMALKDGWFYTGDVGELTDQGFLRITDRKKELIKTSGGKYVAPLKLENLLKTNRFVSQVLIHGDQRKYVVALVTLNREAVIAFAREKHLNSDDYNVLVQNAKVRELVRQAIATANEHLASYESIKNFAILPAEFSIESGEITASLKIKRKVVENKYRSVLDSLYK